MFAVRRRKRALVSALRRSEGWWRRTRGRLAWTPLQRADADSPFVFQSGPEVLVSELERQPRPQIPERIRRARQRRREEIAVAGALALPGRALEDDEDAHSRLDRDLGDG